MIISASYKTDIPAFYGQWFMDKFNKGFCEMQNPYNNQTYNVDLRNADGFVFWTKNLSPFMNYLNEITEANYPFYIQYSINNYPIDLEPFVEKPQKHIQNVYALWDKFGPQSVVWRYDPILYTSLTSYDWHLENFKILAKNLDGLTNEVVVSFAQIYKKVKNNLNSASIEQDFNWQDPTFEAKKELTYKLADIAQMHKMKFSVCGQREFLDGNIFDAKCIDAERLSRIAGYEIKAKRKGHREGCGCYESKDIGAYETCPHGCIYCYAVENHTMVQQNYEKHNDTKNILE